MNTIRRTIAKKGERNDSYELSFEGEKGKFLMCLERFNPYEGYHRVSINLNPDEAKVLRDALNRFLM